MIKYRLDALEAAIAGRNPLLADRLKAPLSESDVKMILQKAKIVGAVDSVIALYSWKNGTVFDEILMASKTGFFPGGIYQFIDLKKAIEHMRGYRECVCSCFPKLANFGGRYLPVFWNGATNWIALDLESSVSRVVLIRFFIREASFKDGHYEEEIREEDPPREAYNSFSEFVDDAIQANAKNKQLACFRLAPGFVSKSAPVQSVVQNVSVNKNVIPATENALVLRTDFSNEAAWKALCAALQDPDDAFNLSLDIVSDPAYDGLTADQLPACLSEDSPVSFAFIIDRNALTNPGHPVLAIDLHDQPGRTFRVAPAALGMVASNLLIANMGFDEFANAVDHDGIFRGFSRI
jgi:hypothetical protein